MTACVHLALPILGELKNLPSLFDCILKQDYSNFKIWVCVNQPDLWWDDDAKKEICVDNFKSIEWLKSLPALSIEVIDKSSKGQGWQGKQKGIGWARKIVMDAISAKADSNDIILTMDADTHFDANYFSTVVENLGDHPNAVALSVPYEHRLNNDPSIDAAILRYEIYMRHFSCHLWRIKNPYSFTALGSATAVPNWAYKAVNGMSPKHAGEDFYFLQKLRKFGPILFWNEEKVYPESRLSDRVNFGTGPALIKGVTGDWESYPIYHSSLFDNIAKTMNSFADLWQHLYYKNSNSEHEIITPLDEFLKSQFKTDDLWTNIHKNCSSKERFIRACFEKVDGLRILQYLKTNQKDKKFVDEDCLRDSLEIFSTENSSFTLEPNFKFESASLEKLKEIRDYYLSLEENYQKESWADWNAKRKW